MLLSTSTEQSHSSLTIPFAIIVSGLYIMLYFVSMRPIIILQSAQIEQVLSIPRSTTPQNSRMIPSIRQSRPKFFDIPSESIQMFVLSILFQKHKMSLFLLRLSLSFVNTGRAFLNKCIPHYHYTITTVNQILLGLNQLMLIRGGMKLEIRI